MPFKEPYNSYYPAIFRPALEAAGYNVSRADDVFTPRPIMLDIQESIIDADLILCEMSERNPNVFYELGLSHAIGKPVILVSRQEEDIPFDLRHIRVIVYDYSRAGWEAKLRESITAAATAITDTTEIWPPPLTASRNRHSRLRALANEIAFNLSEIDTFLSQGYAIDEADRITAGGKLTSLNYITCMTNQFETFEAQNELAMSDDVREKVFFTYQWFRQINICAEALQQAFRPWRARQYLGAVDDFQKKSRKIADKLVNDLR